MTRPTLAIIGALLFLIVATFLAIFLARGYTFNINTQSVSQTGILVVTSDPNGATVYIDGKLETATNTTLNLPPGTYDVKITLDGYSPWEKKVTIKKEEVFKTNAFLFPKFPDLRPLTLTGAINPAISQDGTKIAYSVASASAEKNGIWIIDLARSPLPGPLGTGADIRLIYATNPSLDLTNSRFLWESDGKQLLSYLPSPDLATKSGSLDTTNATNAAMTIKLAYPLNPDQLNSSLTPLFSADLIDTFSQWQKLESTTQKAEMAKLSPDLAGFLATTAGKVEFAPDETKILYQASTSGSFAHFLSASLPGSNPTPETRSLTIGNWYVYDIKEDRNYYVSDCSLPNTSCQWFPSSRHLLFANKTQIWVSEFDGTNSAVLYAGPFLPGFITVWPNWSKIIILTSLNNTAGIGENLYTINLR